MIVRSNQLGVRRLKTRRGGPRQGPAEEVPYVSSIKTARKGRNVKYSAIRNPQSAIGNKGFTLIEIIILIVMAGILLPAIIVPFVSAVKASGKPEMVNNGHVSWSSEDGRVHEVSISNAALNPTALTSYAAIAGFSGYEWQWEIYYVDSNFSNPDLVTNRGYKRILVRVKRSNERYL